MTRGLNGKTVPIRLTVLSTFMLVVCMLVGLALGLQYYFSRDLAKSAARSSFLGISEKVGDRILSLDRQSANLVNVLAHYGELRAFPNALQQRLALPLLTAAMEDNPSLYSTYVGYENGDFFEVINLESSENVRKALGAAPNDRWVVITITAQDEKRVQKSVYLDHNLDPRFAKLQDASYDPRQRPWFIKAAGSPGIVKTAPYMFSMLKSSGVTYAKAADAGRRVIGVDISLAGLGKFLQSQRLLPGSEAFLFDGEGNVTAQANQAASAVEAAKSRVIPLTKEEQDFVARHPIIRASNELDWPPFDFALSGKPRGYSIDLLNLLADRAGLKVEYVNGYDWNGLVALFKKGDLDVLHSLVRNEDREKMGIFTPPYLPMPQALATRAEKGAPRSLADLVGKTVAIPKGWATDLFLEENHPEIKRLHVQNALDALKAVENGQADATLDSAPALSYLKAAYFLDDIALSGEIPGISGGNGDGLHFLAQPDKPELAAILSKGLASLTDEDRARLKNTWLTLGAEDRENASSLVTSGLVPHPELLELAANAIDQGDLSLMTIKGKEYFGYVARLSSVYGGNEFLGFLVPVKETIKPYMAKVRLSLLITLGLLLLLTPVVWYCATLIVKPINALMRESVKVKERRYDEVKKVDSHITEIVGLSASMVSMASSIQQYEQALHDLMDAFIRLIATAIDHKSPYTGGHCARVPELAIKMAEVANEKTEGPFADFKLANEDEWREFRVAAWLHDCGKVTTPEYIVDKATKLETIHNRIHEVRMRFEVLLRDAEIEYLKKRSEPGRDEAALKEELQARRKELTDDFAFIAECNLGGEFMADEMIARVRSIAKKTWVRRLDDRLGLGHLELKRFAGPPRDLPCEEPLLADRPEHIIESRDFNSLGDALRGFAMDTPEHLYNLGEVYNLCIRRGTLTAEDRYKINEHIIATIRMLEKLPYPSNMTRIPEYAGAHHETLIGTGYPRKLKAEEISIPGRILAVADVFEALTASDRPYKKAKTLSEAIRILSFMVKDKHLDADVFRLFLEAGIYASYAKQFLRPDQIDEVDVAGYLRELAAMAAPRP